MSDNGGVIHMEDPIPEHLLRWVVKTDSGDLCAKCQRGEHEHTSEIMLIPGRKRCPCDGYCVRRHPDWGSWL